MMRQRLLSVVVLLACGLTMAFGQSKGDIIKYIEENKLYLNGKDVTVTSLKLEWPLKLDGDGMSPLQDYLCKAILDTEAEDFQSGWTAFHKKLGKEIKRMPDTATRHYVNAKLQMLWTVPEYYASLYIKRQVTDENGKEVSSTKEYITYDMRNGKILSVDDVFTNYVDEYTRELFENLLENGAVCNDEDRSNIDLTVLPKDVAVLGGAVVIGLGGAYDNDNFSTVSANDLYQIGTLKRSFVHWIEGKAKKKKEQSHIAPADFDTSLSTDTLSTNTSSVATFPGGQDSLRAFISKNIEYPYADMKLQNQGRVVVSFIVEKDGTLSDISVNASISPGLDREAVRVVRMMPRWIPAEYNGMKVRTRMSVPVNYRLATN